MLPLHSSSTTRRTTATASRLASLANGTIVAVWQDEFNGNASNRNIEFSISTFSDDIPFATGSVAGASGPTDEVRPDVAGLTGGGFVVVWQEGTGLDADIRASIYAADGLVVIPDIAVNSDFVGEQSGAARGRTAGWRLRRYLG